MSEQYTPTTIQVLDAAVQTGFYSHTEVSRWHAAEVRRAKAEALRPVYDLLKEMDEALAFDALTSLNSEPEAPVSYFRDRLEDAINDDRADRIEATSD